MAWALSLHLSITCLYCLMPYSVLSLSPTEASDFGHAGGDCPAPPFLRYPDFPASQSVLNHLPQCNTLLELLIGHSTSRAPRRPAARLCAGQLQRGAPGGRGCAAQSEPWLHQCW